MRFKNEALVLVGAALGGLVGYFAFFWIAQQGFYGLALPGGLLGVGAGVGKTKMKAVSVACGISALLLGFFTEWRFTPFQRDESLGYFVSQVHQLKPITLLMIAAGAGIGFWIPFRRTQDANQNSGSGSGY